MELKKNYNNVTVLKIPNENFDPNLPEGGQNLKTTKQPTGKKFKKNSDMTSRLSMLNKKLITTKTQLKIS